MADSTVNRAFKAIARRDAQAHVSKSTKSMSSEMAETGRTAERGIHQAKRRTKFKDQSKVNPVYKWR
jgi:hypothetical protein